MSVEFWELESRLCIVADCRGHRLAAGLCQTHYDRRRRYPNVPLEYVRPTTLICDCGHPFTVSPHGEVPAQCAACRRSAHRAASRSRRYRSNLKEYGLTPAMYEALVAEQGGVCAICSEPPTKGRGARNGRLSVDHDHETGTVRGLLCHGCNAGLGNLRDDPELLRLALRYLEGRG